MQIITAKANSSQYIWASLGLIGEALDLQANILLTIKNGLIQSRQAVLKKDLPGEIVNHPGFSSIDNGAVLLPALIDAHVHIALGSNGLSRQRQDVSADSPALNLACLEDRLKAYTDAGICCIRDGGDRSEIGLSFKSSLHNNGYEGPRIVASGSALRRDNAYGSFLGRGYVLPQEIPVAVKRLCSIGADQIKVLVSGMVSFNEYGRVDGPLMPMEDLAAIVCHAKRHGLKVMAHANSAVAVEMAVRAGVDSIEHGYYIDQENMKLMAENKIAWVPTVIPVAAQVRGLLLGERTIEEVGVITRIYEEHLEKLTFAHRLGVPLGVGTDAGAAGVCHGTDFIEELLLYRDGALDNRLILKAATSVNAAILGLESELGTIEVGRKANLIAVRGNPLANLTAIKEVFMHFSSI